MLERLILPNIDVERLRKICNALQDDPMYEMFLIEQTHAEQLEEFVQIQWNMQKYEYFLDYYETRE